MINCPGTIHDGTAELPPGRHVHAEGHDLPNTMRAKPWPVVTS